MEDWQEPGVWLQRRDEAGGMARFYAVSMTFTLFGDWAVVREWGRIGQPGTVRENWYETAELAEAAALRLVRQKKRRGYRDIVTP